MPMRSEILGGLSCKTVSRLSPDTSPRFFVVLCHGFGAPGTDLVPIGDELLDLLPSEHIAVEVVFPAAPLSLDDEGLHGGRAWWPIDMNELLTAVAMGNRRILRDQRPAGMDQARDLLLSLLNELRARHQLPHDRFVIGGFSQGAMLAVDAALHWSQPPGGLCLWSGTLISEATWRTKGASLQGMPVVQSHGRQDPILPFSAALSLRDFLTEFGANVEFLEFNGPHTIPMEGLQRLANLVARLTAE
jgi:phospholipase/carboxylesterase